MEGGKETGQGEEQKAGEHKRGGASLVLFEYHILKQMLV